MHLNQMQVQMRKESNANASANASAAGQSNASASANAAFAFALANAFEHKPGVHVFDTSCMVNYLCNKLGTLSIKIQIESEHSLRG